MRQACCLHLLCCLGWLSLVLTGAGCAKEYSYEGSISDTLTIPEPDTTSQFGITPCSSCVPRTEIPDWYWTFEVGSVLACGFSDTAIVNVERSAFTFFGPSSCSSDTGMIISAFLDNRLLNQHQSSITTDRVAFYYYDNVTQGFILVSEPGTRFTLTIDTYNHDTGLTIGQFSGHAFTENGDRIGVARGRFRAFLK